MFSCLQILEAGLTPSQLYVFMPPNLGGFFMVRSYYPSECHADYFDFERIEALKPARSEERFSRNAETDLVCRLLLEKKKIIVYLIDVLTLKRVINRLRDVLI